MTKDKGWGFWGSPKGLSHQCLIKADEAENCVSLGRAIDEDLDWFKGSLADIDKIVGSCVRKHLLLIETWGYCYFI